MSGRPFAFVSDWVAKCRRYRLAHPVSRALNRSWSVRQRGTGAARRLERRLLPEWWIVNNGNHQQIQQPPTSEIRSTRGVAQLWTMHTVGRADQSARCWAKTRIQKKKKIKNCTVLDCKVCETKQPCRQRSLGHPHRCKAKQENEWQFCKADESSIPNPCKNRWNKNEDRLKKRWFKNRKKILQKKTTLLSA